MQQRAALSFLESVTSTLAGFLISFAATPLVLSLFGLPVVTAAQNFGITGVFTVISILRGYVIRRAFNRF